jgi:hypothetical protein
MAKKSKRITVVSVDKKYAEAMIEKRLTKAQVKDLPDFMDYLDDQFWDDVNNGLELAIKEWYSDTIYKDKEV